MLFCNDCSATIARDSSASTSASLLATSVDNAVAIELSPAILLDTSVDTAASRFVTSVDNLVAIELSPAILLETSVDTAASRFATSVDKLEVIDWSPEIRLDTSVDICNDTLVSIDATVDVKPETSVITKPVGVVMVAFVRIKSDCLSKTILVFAINLVLKKLFIKM